MNTYKFARENWWKIGTVLIIALNLYFTQRLQPVIETIKANTDRVEVLELQRENAKLEQERDEAVLGAHIDNDNIHITRAEYEVTVINISEKLERIEYKLDSTLGY